MIFFSNFFSFFKIVWIVEKNLNIFFPSKSEKYLENFPVFARVQTAQDGIEPVYPRKDATSYF